MSVRHALHFISSIRRREKAAGISTPCCRCPADAALAESFDIPAAGMRTGHVVNPLAAIFASLREISVAEGAQFFIHVTAQSVSGHKPFPR